MKKVARKWGKYKNKNILMNKIVRLCNEKMHNNIRKRSHFWVAYLVTNMAKPKLNLVLGMICGKKKWSYLQIQSLKWLLDIQWKYDSKGMFLVSEAHSNMNAHWYFIYVEKEMYEFDLQTLQVMLFSLKMP
jgi:hypothetical protein